MILRFFAAVVLIYLFGFLAFAVALPGPRSEGTTDVVIVPTGGPGRIDRGIEMVERGQAEQLFVSGVDPEVKPAEFAAEFEVSRKLMDCCVTLGFLAVDTRSNAGEAAVWLAKRKYTSVRLVTTDWHMARTSAEFAEALPPGTTILEDAVPSHPDLGTLFLEYNKLLAATASQGLNG